MGWCRQATSHYLNQCCIWFHSAVASIYTVSATGINPNNMIKFYDAIYMASSWSMSERDVLYWNPQNCVTCRMPMQTSQQNQLRFGTSSTAGSTADWLLTWHTHRPDIKNGFFLYWLFIWKFCTKDVHNVLCKINLKQIGPWRKSYGEILRSECGISVLVKWVSGSVVALVSWF